MCVPDNRASNHMKQKLIELNWEIDKPTVMAGDFSIPLSASIEQAGRKPGGV